tara:strand:+ start:112 stop:1722 length:1611 start_codon:yes stop_codon:yes gene_type:complete
MIMKKVLFYFIVSLSSVFAVDELSESEKNNLYNEAMHQMMQKIWTESMEAKQAYREGLFNTREEYLSNVCSTSPEAGSNFMINADVSDSLSAGSPTASVYVSWDNQSSWTNYVANPLNANEVGPGYENTWAASATSPGNSVDWYLAGTVNSEALGFDYGTIVLSGSPHNSNQYFPLSSNMYGQLALDDNGDASSSQDIVSINASYYDDGTLDASGNGDGAEAFYLSMELSGSCCDDGSLFGPWYLYGVGVVNPDSEEEVAYAVGYGNGGFGQLSPGVYKIFGDLASGDISSFEKIADLGDYDKSGSTLQMKGQMSSITGDSQWGEWPNSIYGFIGVGVTVSASLSGLDVSADILDQAAPGLFIMNTISQTGNSTPDVSNLSFDSDNMSLSATYTDSDGNLPWFKSFQICQADGSGCFVNMIPSPDSHTYENGVIFSASIPDTVNIPDGDYAAKFAFADGAYNPTDVEYLDITIGSGGSGCSIGDVNEDSSLNILDVVLLVNLILGGGDIPDCGDANGDSSINILDVVLIVNLILNP